MKQPRRWSMARDESWLKPCLSQLSEHAPFGGVVPEIAARTHLRYLSDQVRQTMAEAGVGFPDLGGVAATSGPGLIGGLIVGCQFGKGVAIANRLPFVAVNHLEAHALTARLPGLVEGGAPFPVSAVSAFRGAFAVYRGDRGWAACRGWAGPSTMRLARLSTRSRSCWGWIGRVDRLWKRSPRTAIRRRYPFPRPMMRRPGCDLSFSGLKTAVAQTVSRMGPHLSDRQRADIAASFQQAVVDVLADRAAHAMDMMRMRFPEANLLVVAGGVASNASVRAGLAEAAASRGFRLVAPPVRLCSDNAVMVAWAGRRAVAAWLERQP